MSQKAPQDVNINEDATGGIISSVISCMVLAGLATIGRFVSRRIQKITPILSDYLILGGLAGAWVISLIIIEGKKVVARYHEESVY